MNTVLDKPDIAPIELSETLLHDVPSCQSAQGCSSPAEWSCVMRCCKDAASLCSPCLAKAKRVAEGHSITCQKCWHYFGPARFELIVRTIPL